MEPLGPLNPLLHSRLRLAIMSILVSVEKAEFLFLQERTESTPGNLSVQLDKLEKAGYIQITKGFKGKKPLTTCRIKTKGKKEFEEYVKSIQAYLNPD